MDCQKAILIIEQCFDAGQELSVDVECHVEECTACKTHFKALSQLNMMMGNIPVEAPKGIEDRIVDAIEQEQQSQKRPLQLAGMVAMALVGLSLIAWLLPIQAVENTLMHYAERWLPDTQWLGAGMSYQEQVEMMMAQADQWMSHIEWVSSTMVWGALASAVLLLTILNGLCASQMRHSSH